MAKSLNEIKIQRVFIPYYNFSRNTKLTFNKFYNSYYKVFKGGRELLNLDYNPLDYNLVKKPYSEDFKGLSFLFYESTFYLIGGWKSYKADSFDILEEEWHSLYGIDGTLNKEADNIFEFFNINFKKEFWAKHLGTSKNLLSILQTFNNKFQDREPFVVNLKEDNFICRHCNIDLVDGRVVNYKLGNIDLYIHNKLDYLV